MREVYNSLHLASPPMRPTYTRCRVIKTRQLRPFFAGIHDMQKLRVDANKKEKGT
jgi:hypothetical protein